MRPAPKRFREKMVTDCMKKSPPTHAALAEPASTPLRTKPEPVRAPASGRATPPEEDLSGLHTWLILWKAQRAVEQNALRSIARLGLGLSEFAAMELLLHKGPQPVNTIGKKILLTSGSITTAIDRLEARNLVRRMPHPTDHRARLVELTSEGRDLIQCAFRRHRLDMEETADALSKPERRELMRLLKIWGRAAATRLSET
jgi:MarR family 2-MHQ and catechol resistance regulon transcriptional repressor